MKFEAVLYREKTIEFFVRKGLYWHGSVILYIGRGGQDISFQDGDDVSILFFYHLLSNKMTQVIGAVLLMTSTTF